MFGRDPCYVIDPGPDIDEHLEALVREVGARGGAAAILVTHDHRDHIEGAAPLRERLGAPLVAPRADADERPSDGGAIGPLTAVATPGHASEHYAFVAGGACFAGDLVLGVGSVFVPGERGALAAYLASLERLRSLPLDLIAPGHGPLVTDPARRLDECREHRLERERALVAALADGVRDHDELLDRVWADAPAALRGAAASTLAAHLAKLADEGRLPAA